MDMSLSALWLSMSPMAKGVVILMFIMSVYSLWVMIERFVVYTQAKNQSLKLLGALSNVLTRGDYQQAIDITKKYKQSHLAKVISAGLLGADRIILMGRHTTRTDLGREFGATDVAAGRGTDGVTAVKELTGGFGTDRVLECVGLEDALVQAAGVVTDGGTISRVGVPQYEDAPVGFASLFGKNITLTGGPAPVRAYIEELLPDILDGRIEPGRVFDRVVGLDEVPDGYRAMNDRESIKVMVNPT